jgi:hypothetical protein
VGREKEVEGVELGQESGDGFQGIRVGIISMVGGWRHCFLASIVVRRCEKSKRERWIVVLTRVGCRTEVLALSII